MTDDNTEGDAPELVLEEVVEVALDDLSDDQKTYLQDNADDLTDEQKETYKDVLEKEEEEGDVDPEGVEIETRKETKKKEKVEADPDDGVDPDDDARISKVVDKKLKDAGVEDAKDQMEVDSFIRVKPEYGKYRAVALKYMKSTAYNNIPVHNIMAMVAAKDHQKIGARKEREASEKVKETKGGGKTVRKTTGTGIDWGKASAEEVAAKRAEIMQKRR